MVKNQVTPYAAASQISRRVGGALPSGAGEAVRASVLIIWIAMAEERAKPRRMTLTLPCHPMERRDVLPPLLLKAGDALTALFPVILGDLQAVLIDIAPQIQHPPLEQGVVGLIQPQAVPLAVLPLPLQGVVPGA